MRFALQTVPHPADAPRPELCKFDGAGEADAGVVIPKTLVDLHVRGTTQIAWAPETPTHLADSPGARYD